MSSAIEFRGEALSLAEAARKYDLPKTTLANRLKLGWSVERALTTPARGGRALDLSGQRFGLLTAIERVGRKRSSVVWACRCDCGNTKTVAAVLLRAGRAKTCGDSKHLQTHGLVDTPEYRSWRSMRSRCNNPLDPSYRLYGALGIVIDRSWDDFERFLEDMGPRPDGTSLDRIDPYGNYEPGNCRWADATTQARNRRSAEYLRAVA
jgi:hypothetical protein